MDVDRGELVRRLFVLATEFAEAAHETAVTGQASTLSTLNSPRSSGLSAATPAA